jgi:hypothetical protein
VLPGHSCPDLSEATTAEDTMTTTPEHASNDLPGAPPVVDLATWDVAREELLVREAMATHHRRWWALRAGQIATPSGSLPTVTGGDTTSVAVVIIDAVPSPLLVT